MDQRTGKGKGKRRDREIMKKCKKIRKDLEDVLAEMEERISEAHFTRKDFMILTVGAMILEAVEELGFGSRAT